MTIRVIVTICCDMDICKEMHGNFFFILMAFPCWRHEPLDKEEWSELYFILITTRSLAGLLCRFFALVVVMVVLGSKRRIPKTNSYTSLLQQPSQSPLPLRYHHHNDQTITTTTIPLIPLPPPSLPPSKNLSITLLQQSCVPPL